MKEQNIGFAPICNEAGEPVGAITDRDLAIRVLADGRPAECNIADVMTRDVVACHVGDDLSSAEQLMRDHRKSRIMVCDQGGKLVGVISLSDVADMESEETAGRTLRDVASRESGQPHAS
jgi:CBS domain-containing protein